jgi:hypothetical protein
MPDGVDNYATDDKGHAAHIRHATALRCYQTKNKTAAAEGDDHPATTQRFDSMSQVTRSDSQPELPQTPWVNDGNQPQDGR